MEKKLLDDVLKLFEISNGDIEALSGHAGGEWKKTVC